MTVFLFRLIKNSAFLVILIKMREILSIKLSLFYFLLFSEVNYLTQPVMSITLEKVPLSFSKMRFVRSEKLFKATDGLMEMPKQVLLGGGKESKLK